MMVTEHKTLFEVLNDIDKRKYVMPAFQREYVWELDRIEKLWDSILQGYPFSTFLFWELDSEHVSPTNFFYTFIKECCFKKNGDTKKPQYDTCNIDFCAEDHPTIAVLDGQQRLTSLYLSLFGRTYKEPRRGSSRYPIKLYIELDQSKIDETTAFNTKKYGVYFSENVAISSPTRFEIQRIINKEFADKNTRKQAIENIVNNVPQRQQDYATKILTRLCEAIYDEPLVVYTKVSELMQDDALEMFVRFNSGGKKLTKAEISMSILEAFWNDVKRDFNSVLVDKYTNFGTDFILRTAHMIYGDVIKSNIDQTFALTFKANFPKFKKVLKQTEELFSMMKYDLAKFSSKWNVIIPIIYLIYFNEKYIECAEGLFAYLFRSILFNFYASGTTGKLKIMHDLIYNCNYNLTPAMVETVQDLMVTKAKIDDLLYAEKGSTTAGNILYCLGINNIQPGFDYEQDHIHPDARFSRERPVGMSEGDWIKARNSHNKIPNLQYLRSDENESKGEQDFNTYYLSLNPVDKEKMRKEGFIPDPPQGMDPTLYYSIKNYLQFYEDRTAILQEKLQELLNGTPS